MSAPMPRAAGAHGGRDDGKVHDAKVMDRLIREDDAAVYGDKADASEARSALRKTRACSGR